MQDHAAHAVRIALKENQPPPIDAITDIIRKEARAGVMPFSLYDMECLKSLWWEHSDHAARVAYVQTTQHIHAPAVDAPWGAGAWVRCPAKFDAEWTRNTIFGDYDMLNALPESWAAATHWHAQAHRRHLRFNVKGQERALIVDAPNKVQMDVIDLSPLPPYWRMEYTALRWCLPALDGEDPEDAKARHRKGVLLWLAAQVMRQRLDPQVTGSLWVGGGEVAFVGGGIFQCITRHHPSNSFLFNHGRPQELVLGGHWDDQEACRLCVEGLIDFTTKMHPEWDWFATARARAHTVSGMMLGGPNWTNDARRGQTLDLAP